MEKKYKLKVDARKFFDESVGRDIKEFSHWEKSCIPINLLDEVPLVRVELGRQTSECSKNLSGCDAKGAYFEFTVYVNGLGHVDYSKVDVPVVMDEIQKVLDRFFKNRYTD